MYIAGPDVVANPQVGSPYLTLTAASTKVHLFVLPTFRDKGVLREQSDFVPPANQRWQL